MGIFKEYLTEAFDSFLIEAKIERKEFNLSDAKGKLYEILAGSHLIHGTHKSGMPNKFLSHFRDEEGKSPEEVHDYIKKEIDKRHPGLYSQINQHAKDAAEHMRNHLSSDGHHTVHEGAWTSQAGDHKRFTGEDDKNSDADIMVRTNKGHIGISMKYGGNKDMNLRNNGLESLEKMGKLPAGALTSERETHNKNLQNMGVSSHQEYKRLRDSKNAKEKATANKAEESALQAQKNMAKKMSQGLAKNLSSEDLRHYVKERIAPQTKFQHYRIHSRTDDRGNAEHHMQDVQHDSNKLNHFEHFRVVPHTGGISVKIEGKRKGSDKYEPILDQAIKKGSGPTKGFASATKAPFLTKKYHETPQPTKNITTVAPARARAKKILSSIRTSTPKTPRISKTPMTIDAKTSNISLSRYAKRNDQIGNKAKLELRRRQSQKK
jgi:hypothetical protein